MQVQEAQKMVQTLEQDLQVVEMEKMAFAQRLEIDESRYKALESQHKAQESAQSSDLSSEVSSLVDSHRANPSA